MDKSMKRKVRLLTQALSELRPRNWVAKNNFNRPVRHRDHTQYQRRSKHPHRELQD